MEVTAKEAHLLSVLRGVRFGKFTIHKVDNELMRIEQVESILLREEDGLQVVGA